MTLTDLRIFFGILMFHGKNSSGVKVWYLESEKLKWRTTEQREIKPIVIWQKNWLLCNTMQGATASARLYLIIDTAKTNNLKIYDYLVGCLKSISKRQTYPNIYACKLYCEAWRVHISGVNVCIKKMTKNVRQTVE